MALEGYHTADGDPPEWMEDCLHCPLESCINCRNFLGGAMTRPLEGALDSRVFVNTYNQRYQYAAMAKELYIPPRFLLELLHTMKLPYKLKDKRPFLSRRFIYQQPENIRRLFL